MTENPVLKVLARLTRMAEMHGEAYCRVTWDPENEIFNFTPLLKEHVDVHYGARKHD